MDPQRFKSICAEFKVLADAWKATTDYSEQQRIIKKAKATVTEARELVQQAQRELKEKQLFDSPRSPRPRRKVRR